MGNGIRRGTCRRDAVFGGVELVERDSIRGFDRGNRSRAQGRLLVLIEAESLFNDGTAAVGFGLAISLVAGQDDWRGRAVWRRDRRRSPSAGGQD